MRAMPPLNHVVPRCALILLGGVVSASLVAGWVSPAWSAETDTDGSPSVELGGFAIGDGLEGAIGEADGSFAFSVSAGGVELSWDSRAVGTDRYGLGAGWGMGLAHVETEGGIRVFPSSGGAFAMDASAPSGLAGYPERDVVFRAAAEADAIVPGTAGAAPVLYAYELHELGGNTSYFNADGDLVAQVAANGDLSRWTWRLDAEGRHRLTGILSPDGVETALDWSDPAELVVRPGASVTSAPEGSGAGGEWRVRLADTGVSAVIEPTGSLTEVATDDLGRVERVASASGAETVVVWHETADAIARVERVSVLDESSAELSFREWRQTSGATPSGWPVIDPSTRLTGPGAAAIAPYEAELSDGSTRVTTTFDGAHRMTRRTVSASTAAGELVLQEQRLGYPGEFAGAGESRPRSWSKPSSSTVTYRDAAGGERSGSESYEFDALGRLVRRESADGRVMERTYDEVVPTGRLVPIGLPSSERTTAPDGSAVAVEYELSEDRTAPVVTETTTTVPGLAAEVTARTEFDVEDGLVTEQRVFPAGDTSAAPLITRWAETVDPAGGVTRTSETTAAGTPLEVTGTTETSLVHGGVLAATGAAGTTTRTTYDSAGRVVRAADGTAFAWDAANRQIRETRPDGTEIATRYWADGSRRERSTVAGSTEFFWDGATLINDVHTTTGDEHPDGSASYLIGVTRHARAIEAEAADGEVAFETGYFGTDRHGNVTSVTDDSGSIVTTYEYSDYGVPVVAGDGERPALPGGAGDLQTNPFRYASEYTHDDGTQFLRERIYDPELMSLTSEDRERLHNRYGYADANPIMLVDPSGRFSVMDRVAVALGAFSALSSFSGAVLAFTGGGLGLTVFGVAAGLVGIADAVFTAAETQAIVTDTRFMSEEAAVGVGAGLAAVGLLLNVPGAIARYLKSRAPKIGARLGGKPGDQPRLEPGPAESGQPGASPLVEPDELEGVPKVVQNAQQLAVRALPRFAIEDVLETVTDTNPYPMWLRNARATAVYHITPLGPDGVVADAGSPFDVAQSTIEKLSKMRDALVLPQGARGGSYGRRKLELIEGHLSDATKWLILQRVRSGMVLSDEWLSMDPYLQQLSIKGLNNQAQEFSMSVSSALMEAERLQARNIVPGAGELTTSLESFIGSLDSGLFRQY